MKIKPSKIENVEIQIVKMEESSGNKQFFVRAKRKDEKLSPFGNMLDYSCFQTKNGNSEVDCVEQALFSVGFLLNFFGHCAEDVKFINFTDDNMTAAKNYKLFWRICGPT